jgi:hypothetical protein
MAHNQTWAQPKLVSNIGDVYSNETFRRVAMPTLESLQSEIQELTLEMHKLQRQASSRRGPEGPRGQDGKDSNVPGPVGPAGTVSRDQAIEMFKEVVKEVFKDETLVNALKEVVEESVSKTSFRLVRKSAA